MNDRPPAEAQAFPDLKPFLLEEAIRQFRAARNDILRYGVWNVRNLTDEEFNHVDDRKLFNYFRQDLLETRFLSKGRRVDIIQVWKWFDDQMSGVVPMLVDAREEFLNVQDKDLEKLRRRISEVQSFMPTLRSDDLEAFKRVKYKLRRTVMRLTYDLHHLAKRLDKYRKNAGMARPQEPHEAPADLHPPEGAEEVTAAAEEP